MELRSVLTYFLIKWNQEIYVLLRIRFIMGLLMLVYLVMFFSAVARFSPQAGNTSIVNFLDAFSDSILMYILGTMQAAPFKNQLFPIWAITLVSFRSSVNCLSRYGTYAELKNVLKLLAVGYMNVTHGSKFWLIPFWVFWSFLVLKSISRILARYLASKSLWHGRSSELLQEYMDADNNQRNFRPDMFVPETMEGYRYLVYGESKQNRNVRRSLSIKDSRSLITLDKIWRFDGPLLRSINRQGNNIKDLCLAFALSRLLRCKLEGGKLHAESVLMTRKLICSRILTNTTGKALANDVEKAFGILGMDLAFLNDYTHTSYPMVFWGGLCSLAFTLLQFTVRYSMIWWLAVDIRRVHSDLDLNTNIDILITWIAMFFIMCMDIWEMVAYFLSDWTTLLCACKCVSGSKIFGAFIVLRTSVRSPVMHSKGFVGIMGQYVFLQSFNYTEWKWNVVHTLTMGMIKCKGAGTKLGSAIELPEKVKVNVFQALCCLRSLNIEAHYLPRNLTSLHAGDQTEWYWSTCFHLPSCSHVILVWHIATSLCEMNLSKDHGTFLGNPGCLHTALSFLMKWCCLSEHYLVDEKILDGNLRTDYEVANCLSRYSAYLLVSKPDLLPDTILVPKKVIRDTVFHAREMLQDCGSLQNIYDKLMAVSQETVLQGNQDIKLIGNVVQQGARLGKELICNVDKEQRWKILANIWVNLLIHIAPSSNAEAHTKYLESGGEFITLIWALLCHCGIEKSELWQENAA
ncbi:hypothetical protein ACP4OV_002418 [Aristida adscensionis]